MNKKQIIYKKQISKRTVKNEKRMYKKEQTKKQKAVKAKTNRTIKQKERDYENEGDS